MQPKKKECPCEKRIAFSLSKSICLLLFVAFCRFTSILYKFIKHMHCSLARSHALVKSNKNLSFMRFHIETEIERFILCIVCVSESERVLSETMALSEKDDGLY